MVRSAPLPTTTATAEIDDLERIRAELSRRGWPTRLARSPVMGEVDVRLQVGAFGALMVELLGPFGDRPCGDRWQAVRITPGKRTVWCGPRRNCPPSEAIKFVEHLLSQEVQDVTGRYDPLG
jgi:hypothetical protein